MQFIIKGYTFVKNNYCVKRWHIPKQSRCETTEFYSPSCTPVLSVGVELIGKHINLCVLCMNSLDLQALYKK